MQKISDVTIPAVTRSSTPKTSSSQRLPASTNRLPALPTPTKEHLSVAAERARLLFGSYRKGDANDPETYTAAITAILADYPEEVIRFVTHPRTGIARVFTFLPNPADVSDFCDAVVRSFSYRERMAKASNGKSYVLVGMVEKKDGRKTVFEGKWDEV